jgi:hypothetical protein
MSIPPLITHANKATACWRGSNEITDVQEAIGVYRLQPLNCPISPSTTIGVLGEVSADSVFNNASVYGTLLMNLQGSTGSAYVIELYLTQNEDGSKDNGYGSVMTGISVNNVTPLINLEGLSYSNPNGTADLYLGFTITTAGTTSNTLIPQAYSGGNVAYASQYTYSAWNRGAGVPVAVFCE